MQMSSSHTKNLGFKNEIEYQEWCLQNGFSTSSSKTARQHRQEWEYAKTKYSEFQLKKNNKSKSNFKNSIEEIRQYKPNASDLNNRFARFNDRILDTISEIYHRHYSYDKEIKWPDDEIRNLFLDVLVFLKQKTKLLVDTTFIIPIAKVVVEKDSWIRSYVSWDVKSYNAERQFSSLLRHLFTNYQIPTFLDSLWMRGVSDSSRNPYWFIHVCSGKNITTCSDFIKYYPMTKKIAHNFMQAPSTFSIREAFCYGKIITLGGSMRLINTLLPTKWVNCQDEEFSNSVVKFFIDNPMLDYAKIQPIIDYIWAQKFEVQRVGTTIQPNFSMKGRTVDSILNQVEHWHKQLSKAKSNKVIWQHSSINDFSIL